MQQLIRGEVAAEAKPGNPTGANQYSRNVDNVNIPKQKKSKGGNAPTYALRRLKRDRPDLAEKAAPRITTGYFFSGGINEPTNWGFTNPVAWKFLSTWGVGLILKSNDRPH